jgi:hypothetical protein
VGIFVAIWAPNVLARGGRPVASPSYEVWLTDQNNTAGFSAAAPRGTHGGRGVIYDGADLDNPAGPVDAPTVLDMANLFAVGGPNNPTGAPVVRPHMVATSPNQRFVALAFVASGHVAIFDGATKQPLALFRMSPGGGGARQAHAAEWLRDGSALIVANQNGKLLERISYNAATGTFTHDTAGTLNLATCTTPSGFPCQSNTPVSDLEPGYIGEHNRPDNAPICPVVGESGSVFVTLRGGGLFVVDPTATPMAIVAAYGNAYVKRDGCGGQQDKKNVYLNGGTGTLATNPTEFSLYHFRDQYPKAPGALADNSALPDVFFRDVGHHGNHRDAHGMGITSGNVKYLWQFDRLMNVAEVFRLPSKQHVGTVDLTTAVSSDPTPDISVRRGDRWRIRKPPPSVANMSSPRKRGPIAALRACRQSLIFNLPPPPAPHSAPAAAPESPRHSAPSASHRPRRRRHRVRRGHWRARPGVRCRGWSACAS